MRPLTRGAQGTYPWIIDLTSQPALNASLTAAVGMQYNAAAVVNVIGNYPTMRQQLDDVWLTVTRYRAGEIPAPANLPQLVAARPTIVDRNGDEYRLAGNPLIVNTGLFCAYCEKPSPSPPQVEHQVPKDNFPLFAVAWDNFVISCPACNVAGTGKGTGPFRATVAGWPGGPPATQLGYYTACRARYLWPDQPLAYRNLLPQLQYFDPAQAQWRPVPAAESVRPGIRMVSQDFPNRRIVASIYLDATNNTHQRAVRVMSLPVAGVGGPEAARSDTYFGLDQPGGAGLNPAVSDSRMYDRTRKWFDIVREFRTAAALPPADWAAWWADMPNHVGTVGQFSIWVKILQLINAPDPQNAAQTLLTRFLNDCTGGPGHLGFPGTDTTQVP